MVLERFARIFERVRGPRTGGSISSLEGGTMGGAGYGLELDAGVVRRVLPEVCAGVLGDQAEAGRGGPGAAGGLSGRWGASGRRGPSGAAAARPAQSLLDAWRTVARDRDVPGPVGVGVLGAGAGRRRPGR